MEYGWKAVRYSRVGPKAENGLRTPIKQPSAIAKAFKAKGYVSTKGKVVGRNYIKR